MRQLKEKVIVITGAGSGIGRELALQLADQGSKVALNDINPEPLEETARLIEEKGGVASIHLADIADRADVSEMVRQIIAQYGQVDVLINNAGVTIARNFVHDISWEQWEWMVKVNFWGPLHCIKLFFPHLKKRPQAHIVTVSSIYSMMGMSERSAYCASKFALRGLTESLIQEVKGTGIGITSVLPGGVRTNITKHSRGWKDENAQAKAAKLHKKSAQTSPAKAAASIIKAIKRNKRRLIIGPDGRVLDFLSRYFPSWHSNIIYFFFIRVEQWLLKQAKPQKSS